jgi:hypothetical protein
MLRQGNMLHADLSSDVLEVRLVSIDILQTAKRRKYQRLGRAICCNGMKAMSGGAVSWICFQIAGQPRIVECSERCNIAMACRVNADVPEVRSVTNRLFGSWK